MIGLITNPFCPYCYGNDRTLEKEIPTLSDEDIMLMPMDLTPDVQEFDDKLYARYHKMFNDEALPYLHKKGLMNAKYYKQENIAPSKLVFLSYYVLREFNKGLDFYHEVTKRFYETDFYYGDKENLAKIVEFLGVDKEVYFKMLEDKKFESMFEEYQDLVEDSMIDTVPCYVIDGEVYFSITKGVAELKNRLDK
ncbi:MAG: DsbA family protein [Erysipelotrichales bacterium]